MRHLCLLLCPLFFLGKAAAQPSPTPRPVTLTESLAMALEHSGQLKKARLDREGFEEHVREGRSNAYPQISAGLNADYYPELPTQLVPGSLVNKDVDYIPTQFNLPWQFTAQVHVEQQLYNEAARRTGAAVNVTRSVYDLLTERTEEEVLSNTATVFYQMLQTEQLLRTISANSLKLDTLKTMAELQVSTGYAIPTDVKRIRVARTNLQTQRQNLLGAISSLRQTLQLLCGVPFDQPFEPTEDMSHPAADSARWLALTIEPETTTEHRLLLRNLELNRIQVNSLRGESWPSLSAYTTGYYQAQRPNLTNVFNIGRRWYGMAVVGVKLNVPIFDGFRRLHKIKLLKIEEQKLEADRMQLEGAKTLEFRQAREQVLNALRGLSLQNENVQLAREIADKMLLQYQEGIVSLSELLNTQTAIVDAEANYWQQVFTYRLAVVKLLKAVGRLEDLKA
ncbi:MAG: TolC family protein [Saprospiraceae bacterium]